MAEIPGHPFDLGACWDRALSGDVPDWRCLLNGYVAAVDWPSSMFWRELGAANPDALVLLSVRESAEEWWRSAHETILPFARMSLAPHGNGGGGFVALLERFAGTERWDDAVTMMTAYERHNADVREGVPPHRLLEWRATEGWAPICHALGVPVPDRPFPWIDGRSDRGS